MTMSIHEIIRAIRDDPEARDELRRALLTDELLAMPKQLAELVTVVRQHGQDIGTLKDDVAVLKTDVAELKDDVAVLKTDVAELKSDMVEVKSDIAELKSDMVEVKSDISTLNSRVADLSGTNLESKIVTSLPPFVSQMLGLERTRLAHQPRMPTYPPSQFMDEVYSAADNGRISDEEADRLNLTDLVIAARRKADRSSVWIAVEASGTIARDDISKVSASVTALRSVYDADAVGVVVGYQIRPEDMQRAEAVGIYVKIEELTDQPQRR